MAKTIIGRTKIKESNQKVITPPNIDFIKYRRRQHYFESFCILYSILFYHRYSCLLSNKMYHYNTVIKRESIAMIIGGLNSEDYDFV